MHTCIHKYHINNAVLCLNHRIHSNKYKSLCKYMHTNILTYKLGWGGVAWFKWCTVGVVVPLSIGDGM